MENTNKNSNENCTGNEVNAVNNQASDMTLDIKNSTKKAAKKGIAAFWERSIANKIFLICGSIMIFVILFSAILAISLANEEEEAEVWPDTEMSRLIPEPNGEITYVTADDKRLNATVKMSAKKAYTYRTKCKEMGFTNISEDEKDESDYTFKAKDVNNNELSLTYYEDDRELEIELEKTDDAETSDSTTSSNTSTTSSDFKSMMDSYEAFMNEYISFMKKYQNSSDTSAMLNDYSKYMQKFTDFTSKIDAVDESTLSAADYNYYIEVTTRVNKKLATIDE